MSDKEIKAIEKIRSGYTEHKTNKFDELIALNARVRRPAEITAYVLGTIGALVLGAGMCLAMPEVFGMMVVGIPVGVVGIALVSTTYFIYKAILKSRKKKYASRILTLSDELLNKNED